jgi:4-diphosphocytidyl-2-C-methyl-D-erythritol kinase
MAEGVVEPAPAKLNLFLRVSGRRPDGFHDIETLILPITLADHLTVEASGDDLQITVLTTGPHAEGLPDREGNLAFRAAAGLRRMSGRSDGVRIVIDKRIPVAAGLGGGSADAAATLRALDGLWSLDLSPAALQEVAAALGSDVPALLLGGPVVARGRGEHVARVDVPTLWWVLVTPPVGVPAGDAYRWWDQDGHHAGPDPAPVIEAAEAGDADSLSSLLFNDLERPVGRRHPEMLEATRALLEGDALTTIMCGSGPTVAGLCRGEAHANDVAAATGGLVVSSLPSSPDRLG